MPDQSLVFELYHNLWQRQILNPLNQARDQICNLLLGFISAVPQRELFFLMAMLSIPMVYGLYGYFFFNGYTYGIWT